MNQTYTQKVVARNVFRAYDIRGIVNQQLDEGAYYSIGKVIACRLQELKRKTIYVAQDGRLSSPSLTKALIQGLLTSGIDVIDLGQVATPIMYFATNSTNFDCGLMVTGSHNPANYNGIKMVLASKTLVGEDIDILYEKNLHLQSISGVGTYKQLDIVPQYLQRILGDIKLDKKLKVVIDAGNGMAGPFAPSLLRSIGVEVIEMYCDVDGRFPNHHPDPTIESNLVQLKKSVLENNADLGIAFDGDADRLGVITNTGELIYPDRLIMLYAKDILARNPGGKIVFDVKCSSHLKSFIEKASGVAIMCPTGHSIVKSIMKEQQALLAGEMSGHLFFKERWYGFDDAIYSACRLVEILSKSPLDTSAQFKTLPNSISTPEIKIPIADEAKFLFMRRLAEMANFQDANIIAIDGLRVEYNNGWGLIRASNTTPCLVARFEAVDDFSLDFIKSAFKTQLHAVDASLEVPF